MPFWETEVLNVEPQVKTSVGIVTRLTIKDKEGNPKTRYAPDSLGDKVKIGKNILEFNKNEKGFWDITGVGTNEDLKKNAYKKSGNPDHLLIGNLAKAAAFLVGNNKDIDVGERLEQYYTCLNGMYAHAKALTK